MSKSNVATVPISKVAVKNELGLEEDQFTMPTFGDNDSLAVRLVTYRMMSKEYFEWYVKNVDETDDFMDLLLFECLKRKYGKRYRGDPEMGEMSLRGTFVGQWPNAYQAGEVKIMVRVALSEFSLASGLPLGKLFHAVRLYRDRQGGVLKEYIKIPMVVSRDEDLKKWESVSIYVKTNEALLLFGEPKDQFTWNIESTFYDSWLHNIAGVSWRFGSTEPVFQGNIEKS